MSFLWNFWNPEDSSVVTETTNPAAQIPSDTPFSTDDLEIILRFLQENQCLTALTRFTSGLVHSPQCKNTCSYTAAGMAVMTQLCIQNNIHHFIFPKDPDAGSIINLKIPTSIIRHITKNQFFTGLTNAIGLLWDVHEDLDERRYAKTGINWALNNPRLHAEWFVLPINTPLLQLGINHISFYGSSGPIIITIHHSFIYNNGTSSYLIDSWFGNVVEATSTEKCIDFERSTTMREHSTDDLQHAITTMNDPVAVATRKIRIMHDFFLAPHQETYSNAIYPILKVCILNQSKLDDVIDKGFKNKDRPMFGGKKHKKRKSKKRKSRRNTAKII